MSALPQLWLPILATAVFIFIASSLIHMVLKWHNSDYRKLANEDDVRAAIRAGMPAPGLYVLPHCAEMKDMQNADVMQKFVEGPVGFVTLRQPGSPRIGASLIQWFVFTVVITAAAAGLAVQTYGIGGNAHHAAHMIGVVTLLVYSSGSVPEGIWMAKPWKSVLMHGIDGAIYATISALTFMWLWP
jgi:hypothetical protein